MDRKYWYWINNIEGIGNVKIRTLLEQMETPEQIFFANRKELGLFPVLTEKDIENILSERIRTKVLKDYEESLQGPTKFVFPDEPDYPSNLLEIYDKPFVLYYRGKLPAANRLKVAIVGSRKCSEYGRHVAMELGRILAKAGADVISGLALGIDSEAHRGVVLSQGRTFGVLAGGVDKCYPTQNYNLYMDIMKDGGILSEYPDKTITAPGMFPLRNRIISGLADVVIVVEAGIKSGSLITANMALEQNRTVYAVPGRIGDPLAQGCNELIAAGAMVITDFNILLEELGLAQNNEKVTNIENLPIAREEKMLYILLLDFTPKSLDTLLNESGLQLEQVIKGLISLELMGYIKEISKNFYVRI